jgi:membrane protein DedA with SNARE-associated domain
MAGHDPSFDAAPAGSAPPARPRPSRRTVTLVSVPLVAMVVMGYIGDASAPTLVDTHPAWLVALNARSRNLALATNYLDAWTYYGIGTVRLLVSDPLFFLLGYWYGDAAVTWMERRTRTWGQTLRQAESWFAKAAYPIVFAAPNNYVCLFAGAAGMPVRAFFAVNLAGTVFRLWLIRRVGEAFESPIDDLVGWIGEYRIPLLVVSVALVLLSIAWEAKRGEPDVTALARLDDELEEIDDELHEGEADADRTEGEAAADPAPPGDADREPDRDPDHDHDREPGRVAGRDHDRGHDRDPGGEPGHDHQ